MTFTAFKSPSADAVVVASGRAWTNPQNAYAGDGVYATATDISKNGGPSHTHGWSGFGFTTDDIPEGATINGVEVRLNLFANGANVVMAAWLSDATNGQSSNSDTGAIPTSEGDITLGGVADLFGNASISDDDVRASTFGVVLQGTNNDGSGTRTISLDHVEVRVDYTAGGGGGFKAAWARNSNVLIKAA